MEELFRQLDITMLITDETIYANGTCTRSVPHRYVAGQKLPKSQCPDPTKVAELWSAENNAVMWLSEVKGLLLELRHAPNTELVLITNTTGMGWADVNNLLCIRKDFNRVYISAKERAAKPDLYVWETVQRWYPEAQEFWMIGNDPIIDIAVPHAMGWKTILVNHPDGVPISEVLRIFKGDKG